MRSGELQVKAFSLFSLAGVIAYRIERDQLKEVYSELAGFGRTFKPKDFIDQQFGSLLRDWRDRNNSHQRSLLGRQGAEARDRLCLATAGLERDLRCER
jgi:hypothetical protein